MSDAEQTLAERGRRGDREAFEELVRRTARGIFARLYLDTGDPQKAEDLAQETFLSAWRSIRTLSDPKSFRPWLYAIAHSVVIDAARKESRKKRVDPKDHADALARQSGGVDDASNQAACNEQRTRMLAVLRSMPEEYRRPLTLRYLAGADYETIERELALSNGSLRGLLSRGMQMLRERLKE